MSLVLLVVLVLVISVGGFNLNPGAARLLLERHSTTPGGEEAPTFVRRARYKGKNPVKFEEKYKELSLDPETVAKVLAKGGTPAGMHVPILLDECLLHLGLLEDQREGFPPQLVVDCTLGYGGHSSAIMGKIISFQDKSKLLCLDQDPIESAKAEARLRQLLGSAAPQNSLRVVNVNFRKSSRRLSALWPVSIVPRR